MLKTKTAIIGTVLLLSNLTFSLYAKPITFIHEDDIRSFDYTIDESISDLLQQRGLDRSAAQRKTKKAFGTHAMYATAGLYNLERHFSEEITMNDLQSVVAKWVLFEKKIDLASYDTLVGLLQEMQSGALDQETLKKLHNVAALNRSLKVQWV